MTKRRQHICAKCGEPATTEVRLKALNLRLAGKKFKDIGKELDMSAAGAHNAVSAACRDLGVKIDTVPRLAADDDEGAPQ